MGQQVPQQQLSAMLQRFTQLLPDIKPQEVSNTLWACGRMQYAPLQLLSALDQKPQQLRVLPADTKPQELANLAWACGQLGYASKQLPAALLKQAVQLQDRGGGFIMQGVCNLCWAAAVLDLQQCVPQVLQLVGACDELWHTSVDEELLQLHQVHLWLLDSQLPAPQGQGLSGVLIPQQLGQCKAAWKHQLAANAKHCISFRKASDFQKSVFAAAQQQPAGTWQQQPEMEQVTEDGAYSIDVAGITAAGVRVAIEADGPSHFIQPGSTLEGGTLCRNRALAARGYAVVSVPYWDWDKLRGKEQQSYLLAKLARVMPVGGSTAVAVRTATGPAGGGARVAKRSVPAPPVTTAVAAEVAKEAPVRRRRRTRQSR